MSDLNLPTIKNDFLPPPAKDMNEIFEFLKFPFENNLIDLSAVRLQKELMRFDVPFVIEPSRKAA